VNDTTLSRNVCGGIHNRSRRHRGHFAFATRGAASGFCAAAAGGLNAATLGAAVIATMLVATVVATAAIFAAVAAENSFQQTRTATLAAIAAIVATALVAATIVTAALVAAAIVTAAARLRIATTGWSSFRFAAAGRSLGGACWFRSTTWLRGARWFGFAST